MKKVALILSIVALCSFTIGDVFNDSTMVWGCSSSNVYHRLPSCSEVKKCDKPTRISLTAAKEKGMTPCSICVDKKEKQNAKATESVNKSKSSKAGKTVKQSPEKKVKETPAKKEKQATKTRKAKSEKKATTKTTYDVPAYYYEGDKTVLEKAPAEETDVEEDEADEVEGEIDEDKDE